ncbi:PHP domain-containing protein [Tissierella creatinophila]|uniref:Putative phosphatase YcdX n=1 Tax=Tissierella creatinophila DSM 6911 TaxID=1123403 RepID=A0A1U7M7J2_TISCR|nr:PHP domain-containing protein [Tissierella creatinophila]OLS03293.1 putative phosphatase YcdX [Tissierella creatinophila DSM 6911]
MRLFGDYHTHTIYSHGTGNIEDNVKVAIEKGLKEIAICDHGPGHFLYGVKKKNIPLMKEEILRLNDKYSKDGINILLGVEANLISFEGMIDMDDELIKHTDILLLGYHYGVIPASFGDGIGLYIKNPLTKFSGLGKKKSIEQNTLAFIKAINRYPIDFITHPGAKVKLDIRELAKEAGKVGTALEINAKHGELSIESIKIAMQEDVEFIVNSDAHTPEDVGNIEKSLERIKNANLPLNRIKNIRT